MTKLVIKTTKLYPQQDLNLYKPRYKLGALTN